MTAVQKVANAAEVMDFQAASAAAVSVESSSPVEKKREIVTSEDTKGSSDHSGEGQTTPSQVQSKGDSKTANEEIRKKVDQINKEMLNHNSEAIFGIHDETNRVTIKIVDRDSKQVLKEFPPEKTLDMLAKLWEVAGIMVDEKR